MKCNSTLLAALCVSFLSIASNSLQAQTTYTDNGTATTYNLNAGDSLSIKTGTYTGYIGTFAPGAKITVAVSSTFQPSGINNPQGNLTVYGTAKFSWFSTNSYFSLQNYGTVWSTESLTANTANQSWTNYFGATLKVDRDLTINNGTTLLNRGTLNIAGSFSVNNGSAFTNNNTITVKGTLAINNSQIINNGRFTTDGNTSFNGSTSFNNSCRFVVNGSLTNNSTNINNTGLIWLPAAGNGSITNNGGATLNNLAGAHIKAVNLTNYGNLKCAGYVYLTGYTYNTGTVGVSGTTSDSLRIYDVTRTSNTTIFDLQYGTVYPNAVYAVFAAPDTINNLSTCSPELLSNISLPVKWNYFYVNLADQTPVLTWSAEQDPGTAFEVQRSYDGINYSSITNIAAKNAQTEYRYEDAQVNTHVQVVYYRIKGIEPNGAIKLSDTRLVKFSNKTGITVQATPNPFNSQLNINYQSPIREKITIRVISMSGSVQILQVAAVSQGYNSIAISNTGSLSKGVYLVQLMSENTVIASERVIKQ